MTRVVLVDFEKDIICVNACFSVKQHAKDQKGEWICGVGMDHIVTTCLTQDVPVNLEQDSTGAKVHQSSGGDVIMNQP